MTGIEATEEMTSDQLDAMAGGELLRSEVFALNSQRLRLCFTHPWHLHRPDTSDKYVTLRNPPSG